ncbi:hypothetical protein CLV98_11861 [Dyadobacter jejuensis]|uniref:Uncharacterized protein n=1 Tax=Dyadobacter jejuensis TaxID=1082580 RepID=A0A316AA69_9BACT|nr:hypothetical protein [Dyadobacter jejuensis]PWJ54299.1 hypothetical protein CLV98_11861 [Dyadobacter jejuensis]
MKKILILSLVLGSQLGWAQVKIGSNPTTITSTVNLEVEATDGSMTVVNADNGRVGLKTTTPTTLLQLGDNYSSFVDGTWGAKFQAKNNASGAASMKGFLEIYAQNPTGATNHNESFAQTWYARDANYTEGAGLVIFDPNNERFDFALSNGTNINRQTGISLHNNPGGTKKSYISLRTNSTIAMRIDSLQNVGIGTTNPLGRFHVDGAHDNNSTGAPTSGQQINDLIVLPDGKVGIGTTSPTVNLQIKGNTAGTSVSIQGPNLPGSGDVTLDMKGYRGSLAAPSNAINMGLYNSLGARIWNAVSITNNTTSGSNLFFDTAESHDLGLVTRMAITNTGNVGIGTTSPKSTLQVQGSIGGNIREITAGTVAENDYTLLVGGDITLPTPSSSNLGRFYHLVNQTGATHTITATFRDAGSAATTASIVLDATVGNKSITVQSDGNQWWIIARN